VLRLAICVSGVYATFLLWAIAQERRESERSFTSSPSSPSGARSADEQSSRSHSPQNTTPHAYSLHLLMARIEATSSPRPFSSPLSKLSLRPSAPSPTYVSPHGGTVNSLIGL
jgi:hypothetical protein